MRPKLTLAFLLYWSTLSSVFAEDQTKDSLETALASANGGERVAVLIELSREHSKSDLSKAHSYAIESIRESENQKNEMATAKAKNQLATVFYQQGKYTQAEEEISQAIAFFDEKNERAELAGGLKILGSIKERQGEYDEALKLSERAYQLAEATEQGQLLGNILNNMAIVYFRKAHYDQAIATYLKAIEIYEAQSPPNHFEKAKTLRNIGIAHKKKGEANRALDYYFQALALHEKGGDSTMIPGVWNSIGTVFVDIGRHEEGREAYWKVLSFLEKNLPSKLHAAVFNNLGKSYDHTSQLDSALYCYRSALGILESVEGFRALSVTLNNIGAIYLKKEEYHRALDYFNQALAVESIEKNWENTGRVWNNMGRCYLKTGEFASSQLYLEKALRLAEQNGIKSSQVIALQFLSELHEALGNHEKALHFYKRFSAVQDSLFNANTASEIEALVKKYEGEKQQAQLQQMQQRAQIEKLKKWGLLLGLLVTALSAVVVLIFQWQRIKAAKREKRMLDIQNNWLELQSLRNQLKPHFVFNALTSIQHFLLNENNEKALRYLEDFSQLMREMLENTEKNSIALEEEIGYLSRYLALEQLRTENKFTYTVEADESLDLAALFLPNLLLQPIVENAVWHGVVPKKGAGHIHIRFAPAAHFFKIEITDNGVGRQASTSPHRSKGLELLHERIEFLNKGKEEKIGFRIEDLKKEDGSPAGTKVTFEIPT